MFLFFCHHNSRFHCLNHRTRACTVFAGNVKGLVFPVRCLGVSLCARSPRNGMHKSEARVCSTAPGPSCQLQSIKSVIDTPTKRRVSHSYKFESGRGSLVGLQAALRFNTLESGGHLPSTMTWKTCGRLVAAMAVPTTAKTANIIFEAK